MNIVEGGVFQQMNSANKWGPLYMVGWYNLGDADFAAVWYTKAGLRTKWSDPEYEKLFIAARSTNDEAEREKIYRQMMVILNRENPSLFLFSLPSIYGVAKNVSGFGPAADKVLRLSKVELK